MSLEYRNDDEQHQEVAESIPASPAITPYYTYILLGCIICVTLAQFATNLDESIMAAGFVKPAFLRDHEYWRILTGGALHGSVSHILFNGYALFSFGKTMEFLTDRANLAIVFLIAVVGGGLLSLVFLPGGISVGASGGIVGFIGYLAVYGVKRRKLLAPGFLKSILINIGFMSIFGIALYQTIDNFGHLGGLLAGAVYGYFQIPDDLYVNPRKAGAITEIFGLGALGIFVAVSIFSILLILKII